MKFFNIFATLIGLLAVITFSGCSSKAKSKIKPVESKKEQKGISPIKPQTEIKSSSGSTSSISIQSVDGDKATVESIRDEVQQSLHLIK